MRLIMVSGKGGVGKTTVAAATGVATAARGLRTLVLSFDLAHSLSDSFDLDSDLFDQKGGRPFTVSPNLDIQEIDVQEELNRDWSDLYRYTAELFVGGGMNNVLAEEVAILPGTEDIIALLQINNYVTSDSYDVIVVDCPPTTEALRFVNISGTIDWYIRKRFNLDRKISQFVRPVARMLTDSVQQYLPEDNYFSALKRLFERLEGVEEMLRDPQRTSVRLVTNAEKMVLRETQRAYMYFSMYGMTIDQVIVNRLMPEGTGYFDEWRRVQLHYAEDARKYFEPVPMTQVPLFDHEIIGLDRLHTFADTLYDSADPTALGASQPPFVFVKDEDGYALKLLLPFVSKDRVDLARKAEDLVIRIGSFKRNIVLPRALTGMKVLGAAMNEDSLTIRFEATKVEVST